MGIFIAVLLVSGVISAFKFINRADKANALYRQVLSELDCEVSPDTRVKDFFNGHLRDDEILNALKKKIPESRFEGLSSIGITESGERLILMRSARLRAALILRIMENLDVGNQEYLSTFSLERIPRQRGDINEENFGFLVDRLNAECVNGKLDIPSAMERAMRFKNRWTKRVRRPT